MECCSVMPGICFRFGRVERVKKIKDYAFVHFEERDQAVEGRYRFIKSNWSEIEQYLILV